jgi:hypothetical protein
MMRKVLISLAAAGTALAFATPATAQYFPAQAQSQGYGYGQQYRGGMRSLQVRIDRIQRDIEQLRGRRVITRSEANGLRNESRGIERRLYQASRNGLRGNEMRDIEHRIARLEQHVRREATDGGRRYGNGYGQNGVYADRDRDGRNDRYEDDRGTDHD